MKRSAALITVVMALSVGCTFGPQETGRFDVRTAVGVTVVDESRRVVQGARFEWPGGSATADDDGRFTVEISSPIAGVVTAAGMLPEPLAISPRDREMALTLLARSGSNGTRTTLHFGGDVMLGRRYQAPTRDGTAVAQDAASARDVVADLAPISRAADVTIVNAETVVGSLPADEAYPGKRFLLQSPPIVTDMLDELGVDLVTLGNNHAYDWRDPGVRTTIDAFDGAGMPHTGAGFTAEEALQGALIDAGARRLGIVSVTTVNGSFVNDQLPLTSDEVPGDLPPDEAWQYEQRSFEFGTDGAPGHFPPAERRAGDAWQAYLRIEDQLAPERAAALWAALTADDAYPELQDWIARRGHGGAAGYDREAVAEEIGALRDAGADLVVVQFHGGFQFAEVKSSFIRRISHRAIDAGADMVVSHHPHVLQGLEWYRGSLIAYSLGNLVFDQDFLSTFPSMMLRVVVDSAGVVDVRVIPVMLVDYRPVPVAGDAAERIVRLVNTRSTLPAESERITGFEVDSVLVDDGIDGVEPAWVDFERNTGRVGRVPASSTSTLSAGPQASARLPPCLSVRADELPAGVEYGIDLFDWGGFDDVTADGQRGVPMHWVTPNDPDAWAVVQGESSDPTDDALRLLTNANRRVSARFVARATIAAHRLYDGEDDQPIDRPPSYTLELSARRERGEAASARIDVFHVDDTDPTSEPESTKLRTTDIPFSVSDEGGWERITLDLDDALFAPVDELTADAVMVTLSVDAAFRGEFTFDNVRLMEWRAAPLTQYPIWAEIDALRASEFGSVTVMTAGCDSV
ncbi:MAG: CapA family protein [Ilumatobacter sp.]|uniref:CapA family protein n=1 Tax=Ilumatobacter sp. TaxID=1967498 RepID=UPI002620B1FC|nr:CapA family protein [Ilumatobacter sp.]MDJ0768736.1 CapA family protein [Ilumatobacter sp.]